MKSRNQKVLEGLQRAAREDRLHHAYVLSGPASRAKVDCVEQFAAQAFNEKENALERIRGRAHPDFVRIEEPREDEKNAPSLLEQIRELPKQLAYPPLEAARRVILIPDAASLNGTSFNSILKILEEPPAHTMFFLLCRDPGELLQTIVSRCQVLRFAPLSDEELVGFLGERAPADREGLLAWSEGALERAELLLAEEGALALRREACECLLELWECSPRIPSRGAGWVEKIEDDAPSQIVVDTWEVLLRDLAFVRAGAGEKEIRFRECFERLQKIAARGTAAATDEIHQRASAINRFRVYRRLNGNLRLDFAALLAELQIFSVGKSAGPA